MAGCDLHLFVDNSNVLLEGRRFAEMRRRGRHRRSPYLDDSYEIDWGKFLYVVKAKDTRALADVPFLYGSRPPPQDSVWERIRDDGFDVKVFDGNIRNKEKGVDIEMGMDIAQRLYTVRPPRRAHQHDPGEGSRYKIKRVGPGAPITTGLLEQSALRGRELAPVCVGRA